MVARMINHASRSLSVRIRRYRIDETNPPMIRTQSRQKNTRRASAVATCRPTMNARYGDSGADTSRSVAHCPPTTAGRITE